MNFELKNLNENHMGVLIRALDLYTRIGLGQFKEIAYVFEFNKEDNSRENARELLDALQVICTDLPRHSSKSIGSDNLSDEFKVAQDLQEVIRHRLAWTMDPKGGIPVDFDKPHHWSNEPLIEANIQEKGDQD